MPTCSPSARVALTLCAAERLTKIKENNNDPLRSEIFTPSIRRGHSKRNARAVSCCIWSKPGFAQTRAYVTNFTDNTVSVIDSATNTVVATVPVGTNPEGSGRYA